MSEYAMTPLEQKRSDLFDYIGNWQVNELIGNLMFCCDENIDWSNVDMNVMSELSDEFDNAVDGFIWRLIETIIPE